MKTMACIAKTVGLCAILLLICCFANQILNTNIRKYETTATREADGSKVLFIGTSQGYNGINPLAIWDKTGIASYNFCAPGQYIGTTYYVLKDIYNYQNPEVVVLDFECLTRPEDFLTISNKLYSLPMIAGLKNRFDMYQDIIADSPIYFVPMLRYHNRWKEINRMDFRKDYDVLGSGRRITIQEDTTDLPEPLTEESEPIGEREIMYLNRIFQLTKDRGSQLILLDMPSYSEEHMEAITNTVKQWAADNRVVVCEANQKEAFELMGLNSGDFTDEFHLNVYGQLKLSEYLGNWLLNNCAVTDSRGTEQGLEWEERMPKYRALTNDGRLLMETGMPEYFRLLRQGEYTAAISLTGNYKTASEELWPVLEEYGFTREDYEIGGVFVRDYNGEWLFNSGGSTSFLWNKVLGADDLVLRGSGIPDAEGNRIPRIELLFDRSDQSVCSDGVNVLVYNHSTEGLMECVGFEAGNGYKKYLKQ